MNEETINYETRIVAFIDILGFKNIIKRSEENIKIIKNINDAIEFLKTWEKSNKWNLKIIEIEEDAQKKGIENFNIEHKTNCTTFSDSIVVSVQADDQNINEVCSTLIANLAYISAMLLSENFLLRGGITIGKLQHKENGVILGPALIEAYELEKNISKFPRIILSDKLIKKLNYPLKEKNNRYPYHQYVYRFSDGCVGFHQMIYFQVTQSWTEFPNDIKLLLKKAKNVIVSGLDQSFEMPDIYNKYLWIKNEYKNLIILDKNIKEEIKELNENISGNNIHYSYTDDFYYKNK